MSPLLEQLSSKAAAWNVAIAEIRETEGSVLGFGLSNGNRVVLKVSSLSDEKNSGTVLEAFQGAGIVRVHKSDHGAVLLERLDPATELVELVRSGRDDEATHILANTIRLMANHEPPLGCPTLFDWARAFDRYISDHNDDPVSPQLAHEAAEIYRDPDLEWLDHVPPVGLVVPRGALGLLLALGELLIGQLAPRPE